MNEPSAFGRHLHLTPCPALKGASIGHGDGDGRLDSYSPSNSGNTIEMPSVIHTIPVGMKVVTA